MKILIFGGAFDPPHLGHRSLLVAAIDEIKPDLTLVIPSKESPHKTNSTRAFIHRRRMCDVFLDCGGRVRVSSIERFRRGASYTIDTIDALNRRYRGAQFYLLVGTDMLEYFEKWRDYKRLLQMCVLVAGSREDDIQRLQTAAQPLIEQGGRVVLLKNLVTEISSTEIRNALADGKTSELIAPETAEYIRKHGLYTE